MNKAYKFCDKITVIHSEEEVVTKYVFEKDEFIAEAVLYQYEERVVICCSVQSGCPVGCKFCGTGSNFLGNLTKDEIVAQITYVLNESGNTKFATTLNGHVKGEARFQIMFMSMGEPLLNWTAVDLAIQNLNQLYPAAELLVSTMAPNVPSALDGLTRISCSNDKVGVQFSIHSTTDKMRDVLIPYGDKLTIRQIRDYGVDWHFRTGRQPYLNYCMQDASMTQDAVVAKAGMIANIFPANVFKITLSVTCDPGGRCLSRDGMLNNMSRLREALEDLGYQVGEFNPAGQDDIGGGCGQLLYVQEFLNGETETSIPTLSLKEKDTDVDFPANRLVTLEGGDGMESVTMMIRGGNCVSIAEELLMVYGSNHV